MSARKLPFPTLHVVRCTHTYDKASVAFDADIPASSLIAGWACNVTTAYNAGTTNVLTFGRTGSTSEVAGSSAIAEGSTGANSAAAGILSPAADTTYSAYYSQTGTAATAGASDCALFYAPHPALVYS